MFRSICLRVPLLWSFVPRLLLLKHLFLLIYVAKFALPSSSDCRAAGVSQTLAWSPVASAASRMFSSGVPSGITTLPVLDALVGWLSKSLFSLLTLVRFCSVVPLGDEEPHKLTLCSLCVEGITDAQGPVARQTLKKLPGRTAVVTCIWHWCSVCGQKSQWRNLGITHPHHEIWVLGNYSHLICRGNRNLNNALERLLYVSKP